MSNTIDQRVVEMRFDNAHFERNVQTSMSTLDKLKKSLNLDGASKGLENISAAAKNNNLHVLGGAADQVSLKFNAMYSAVDQVFRNMVTKAQYTAEHLIKSFTVEPIMTGFNEYETKMNSIQTIMSNTASKGTTLEDVTRTIDELNTYADKTIYNFTEMTRNIGTFTAAGVGLEESAKAIQGIANLAAASGSNSQQASTAMYQLSQALAAGTVKLMDWNSVVNAGMGGELFQNALKDTARAHGVAVDEIIAKNGSFRESLQDGWLSAEILTETLSKMTKSGAAEYLSNLTGIEKSQINTVQELVAENKDGTASYNELAEKLAATGKITKDEAINILKMADNAEDAATKVKTFTQLMDTLKESVQSGWGKTWEILVGDFDEAKDLFTGISDFVGGFINKMSDTRNTILETAMNSPFGKIAEKIQNVTKATEKVVEATKDYANIVDKVIAGEFGDGQSRWDKLAKDGYDWAKVQNMVNEQLGSSVRHTEQLNDAQGKVNSTQATTIEQLAEMSEGQLRSIGFTTEEIEALKDLKTTAEKAGYTLAEVVDNPDLLKGRNLLIDGFKNIGEAIGQVAKAAKEAWQDIFPPKTIEERAENLHNLIASFRGFTESLHMSEETVDNLQRTFKGLFAAIDIVMTVVGGPLKWAFDAIIQLAGKFDINILELTANMGDAIVKFREWIDANNIFVKGLEIIEPYLSKMIDGISEWIKGFKDAENIPKYIIDGLVNGLKNGVKLAVEAIIELGQAIIDGICDVLGIHSPSVAFMAIGGFIIAGLLLGLSDGAKDVVANVLELGRDIIDTLVGAVTDGWPKLREAFKSLGTATTDGLESVNIDTTGITEKLKEFGNKLLNVVRKVFDKIDLGTIVAVGLNAGLFMAIKKIFDFLNMFEAPLSGLGQMFEGLGDMFEDLGKGVKSFFKAGAFEKRTDGILNIAKALTLLAVSLVLIASIDSDELWKALGAIAALAGIMWLLSKTMDKVGDGAFDFSFGKMALGMLGFAAALLIMAGAMKVIASIDTKDMDKVLTCFVIMIGGIAAVLLAFGLFVHGKGAENINKAGSMMLKMSVALLIMVGVIKLASMLKQDEITKGLIVVGALSVFFMAVIAVSKLAGEHASKAGSMMIKMSIAMLAMVGVIKLASMLSEDELKKGGLAVLALGAFFAGLIAVTRLANGSAKIGGTLIAISVAMLIIVGIAKLISQMSVQDLVKGGIAILALGGIITGLIAATKLANKDGGKIGLTLLAMSVAIGILAAISVALSYVDIAHLAKGIIAVGLLAGIVSLMARSTKGASNCVGNLVVLTVAIAVLATAVAALSTIDGDKLGPATGALVAVIAAFALVVKASSNAQGSIGTLIVMTVAVGLLGAMLWQLSDLPVENTLSTAASLSILLVALSLSMQIASKAAPMVNGAIGSLLLMGLVVIELAVILGVMSALNVEASIGTATALSVLLLSMSASLMLLSGVGPNATTAVVAAMLMGLVVAELAVVLGVMSALDINPSIETAAALSILLISMSAALVILSAIGPAATGAIAAATSLVAVVGIIGGAVMAIGELMSLIPEDTYNDMMSGIDRFIAIFEKIGYGLGSVIGNIAAGFIDGVASCLPELGTHLSGFMTNAQGFIDGCNTIDESTVLGAGSLAGAILAITAANVVAGISEALPFLPSLAEMGTNMSQFMSNAQGFITGLDAIKPEHAESAAALGGMILAISAANVLDGISKFLGMSEGGSLETFGAQLPAFGKAIANFSKEVSGKIDSEAVEAAANAGKTLAELNNNIPNSGGKLADWLGDNTFDVWGAQLVEFGKAIVEFSKTVAGNIDENAVNAAANAGKTLAELNNNIPNSGGKIADWLGDNTLDTFGAQLKKFGEAIVDFSKTVAGNINEEAVATAADAGLLLADLNNNLPSTGGKLTEWFMGDNSLGTFGTNIKSFGEALVGFSTTITQNGGISEEAVNAAANAGKVLAEVQASIPDNKVFDGKISIDDFGSKIKKYGEHMVDYSNEVKEVDITAVNSSLGASQTLVTIAKSVVDLETGCVEKFKTVTTIGTHLAAYAEKVTGLDTAGISNSILNAQNLVNLIKSTVGLDASGVEQFKIGTIGTNLKNYITNIGGLDMSGVSTSITAAKNLVSFIRSTVGLDASGVPTFVQGVNQLGNLSLEAVIESFGEASTKLTSVGTDLVQGLVNGLRTGLPLLSPIGAEYVSSITSGVNSGIGILTAAGSDISIRFKSSVESNVAALQPVGVAMMHSVANGIRSQNSTLTALGGEIDDLIKKGVNTASLKTIGSEVANAIEGGLKSKKATITKTTKDIVQQMSKAISDKKKEFKTTGAALITQLADGMKSKKSSAKSEAGKVADAGKSEVRTYYSKFKTAGKYLVEGLADGIKANKSKVTTAARKVASAGLEAAEDELGIASPSKEFYKVGEFTVAGFVNALYDLGTKVHNAGSDMANSAKSGFSDAISKATEFLNTDMDANPTIRPVLDLSDVKTGMSAISGMFNDNTFGASANINAVSAMMNQNGQNGNDDVVSAINKLGKKLDNVGNTYNSVNGVTYDDGSNIADAIGTITRAAKIARRT